jgi:chemotaxis protein methyltransferase CheR
VKIETETKSVIVKGIITQQTLSELENLNSIHQGRLQITFDELDVLPKSIIEWLSKRNSKFSLDIYVTSRPLYGYLQQLGVYCKLMESTRCAKECFFDQSIEVIVIGGSAGSGTVIENLVRHFTTAELSIFIVQHIGEDNTHLFETMVKLFTSFNVITPKGGEKIQTKTIYIAPPCMHMRIENGKIDLQQGDKINYARPSIKALFESVAEQYGRRALAILTCGYGHDGSEVLGKMRELGTSIIVHSPQECEANTLPKSAISTGHINHVLTLSAIESLLEFLGHPSKEIQTVQKSFLEAVYAIYGYDFTLYDPNSIGRRVKNVMDARGMSDVLSFYESVLLNRPLFEELFSSISINVTEFFRKPRGLVRLRELLIEDFSPKEYFKVWIAGCSTGEEAYTVAMILEDISLLNNAIIYATDFNHIVTQIGRNGLYSLKEIRQSDENASAVLQKYCLGDFFESNDAYGSLQDKLRKKVLFFEHNLVTDSSFNEFMIILCKNVLIYFSKELQLKVLQLLYDSLQMKGYLQLGSSETLPVEFRGRFRIYSVEHRIYQKFS